MKSIANEATLKIILTTPTLPLQIAEVRDKLDTFLAKLRKPPKGQEYHVEMTSFRPLRYRAVLTTTGSKG